jgi:ribokinase
MKPNIVVIGSANLDMVVRVPHLPSPGETVLGGEFITAMGGKGANQAVAAARLGAEVTFVTYLGMDSFGKECLDVYQREGIKTQYVRFKNDAHTGIASILVADNSENMIAVAPGANNYLSPTDVVGAEEVIRLADCILLQLEIPLVTVRKAIEIAKRHDVRIILNPAPAIPLPIEMFREIDVLTPNKIEAALLVGNRGGPTSDSLMQLLSFGIKNVIMTMGEDGARVAGTEHLTLPAFQVQPVDTTAAGDAFNAALAVALAEGKNIRDAVRYGNAAGALATTRPYAQPSLPTRDEVDRLIQENN